MPCSCTSAHAIHVYVRVAMIWFDLLFMVCFIEPTWRRIMSENYCGQMADTVEVVSSSAAKRKQEATQTEMKNDSH